MLKVSRLLATGLEILVANAKFSVALATSWSQFRTLHNCPDIKKQQSSVIVDLCLRNTRAVKSHNCRDIKKQQSSVILELCLRNTRAGKSHNCRDIKNQQSSVILDLCLRNTRAGKSHNCRDIKKATIIGHCGLGFKEHSGSEITQFS